MISLKIKDIRGKRSQAEFARALGLERSNFPKYESGQIKPSFEFFKALALKENINLNWLIADQGEMYFREEGKSELARENRELKELLKKVESVIAVEISGLLKGKLKR